MSPFDFAIIIWLIFVILFIGNYYKHEDDTDRKIALIICCILWPLTLPLGIYLDGKEDRNP